MLLVGCLALVGVAACSDSSAAGCATDDDCKGDRACVESKCTYMDEVSDAFDDEASSSNAGSSNAGSSNSGDESTDDDEWDAEGQTGVGADEQTSCSSASDCASDQTCVGSDSASDAGTCEKYWSCDGWGEGHDSSGRCITDWECSGASYALVCPKTGESGSRCECLVDNEVVGEFLYDSDGCSVPDKYDFANFECGWAVSAPP